MSYAIIGSTVVIDRYEWEVRAQCMSADVIVLKRSDVVGDPVHSDQVRTVNYEVFNNHKGDQK